MRQSLSENQGVSPTSTHRQRSAGRAVTATVGSSLVLALAGILDQFGGRSLIEHARAVYTSSGEQPSDSVLYGLVYTVALINALLWLLVLAVARSRRRAAWVMSIVMALISAGFAVALLASTEYGSQIFPPMWGLLAILPVVSGCVANVLLFRRDQPAGCP